MHTHSSSSSSSAARTTYLREGLELLSEVLGVQPVVLSLRLGPLQVGLCAVHLLQQPHKTCVRDTNTTQRIQTAAAYNNNNNHNNHHNHNNNNNNNNNNTASSPYSV